MKQGALADYFVGVGTKVLKGTEIDSKVSKGHELQGVDDFRKFLGAPSEKTQIAVTYVWLSDDEEPVTGQLAGTWYDSRRGKSHRGAEYRMYYPAAAEEIVYRAKAGDRLFLCKPKEGPLLALFCPQGSSIEQQLLWLFGLEPSDREELAAVDLTTGQTRRLDLAARYVLELINIEVLATEDQFLELLLAEFNGSFPVTAKFSDFARKTVTGVDPLDDPDGALVSWMDFEERLFMTLEQYVVGERLRKGFLTDSDGPDVEGFVKFSLGVQNRRKSRAGYAFGNHIEALLVAHKVRYKREATTEKKRGPDFLFPGEAEYHDQSWPNAQLTMLAAKTTCKDRWRQALTEANRILHKHLLTVEPGISVSQTEEMRSHNLQLVVPKPLLSSFRSEQRLHLLNVAQFIELVKARQ